MKPTLPLRILFYTPTVPMEAGGVQAVCRQLLTGFSQNEDQAQLAWPIRDHQIHRSAGVTELPDLEEVVPLLSRRRLRRVKRLVQCFRTLRPQVVNVHFVRPGARYFLRWRRWWGYKVILTFHGSDALRPLDKDLPYLSSLIRRADGLTAVSSSVAAAVETIGSLPPGSVQVIANGIDQAFWSALPRCPPPPAQPRLFAAGRLTQVKGHDVLFAALALLRQSHPQCQLHLAGEGECRANLLQQVAALNLQNTVKFLGKQSAEQVRNELSACSVFVLPSRSEGLPLSLLEAMAAGAPAVASAVGGVPKLLADGCGRVVPPESAAALARALAEALDHPQESLMMAEAAVQRAAFYSLEETCAHYRAVFRRLQV